MDKNPAAQATNTAAGRVTINRNTGHNAISSGATGTIIIGGGGDASGAAPAAAFNAPPSAAVDNAVADAAARGKNCTINYNEGENAVSSGITGTIVTNGAAVPNDAAAAGAAVATAPNDLTVNQNTGYNAISSGTTGAIIEETRTPAQSLRSLDSGQARSGLHARLSDPLRDAPGRDDNQSQGSNTPSPCREACDYVFQPSSGKIASTFLGLTAGLFAAATAIDDAKRAT